MVRVLTAVCDLNITIWQHKIKSPAVNIVYAIKLSKTKGGDDNEDLGKNYDIHWINKTNNIQSIENIKIIWASLFNHFYNTTFVK